MEKPSEEDFAEYFTIGGKNETGVLRCKGIKSLLPTCPSEINTGLKLFERSCDLYPTSTYSKLNDKSAIAYTYTFTQIRNFAKNYVNFIYSKNLVNTVTLDKQDWKFIGIYSKNCVEWIISHFGNMYGDITTVSIYDTLGLSEVEHILKLTKLKNLIIDLKLVEKVLELKNKGLISDLKNLFIISETKDYKESSILNEISEKGCNIFYFKDLLMNETSVILNSSNYSPCTHESIILISFTSGSTGLPKGAIISHQAMANQYYHVEKCLGVKLTKDDIHLSFLPYPHIFESIVLFVTFGNGVNTIYYSGDNKRITIDIFAAKPTFLFSVPRILTRIYDAVQSKISGFIGLEAKIVNLAIEQKTKNLLKLNKYDHFIFDNIVFHTIAKQICGNDKLKFIFTGSAPIDGQVLTFLKILFSCPVLEAYGLTETIGAITCTNKMDITAGHVGIC